MPAVKGSGNGRNGRRKSGPKTDTEQLAEIQAARQLRDRGVEWDIVAGMTGFPSGNAARLAVNNWYTRQATEVTIDERREALREAVSAYNRLIDNWWDDALAELPALREVRALMIQKDRIQALDRTKEDTGLGSVLVIGGTEEEYLAGLQKVIDDPN